MISLTAGTAANTLGCCTWASGAGVDIKPSPATAAEMDAALLLVVLLVLLQLVPAVL
jgi:hypothetical protein